MNLDFDYKIFDLENYLTKDEFVKLNTSLINFDVNVDEINSSLGFLQWSNDVENKVKEIDPIRYNKIVDSYSLNYTDYCFLNKLNDQYGFLDTLQERVTLWVEDGKFVLTAFGGIVGVGKVVLNGAFAALTILILTLYFMLIILYILLYLRQLQ